MWSVGAPPSRPTGLARDFPQALGMSAFRVALGVHHAAGDETGHRAAVTTGSCKTTVGAGRARWEHERREHVCGHPSASCRGGSIGEWRRRPCGERQAGAGGGRSQVTDPGIHALQCAAGPGHGGIGAGFRTALGARPCERRFGHSPNGGRVPRGASVAWRMACVPNNAVRIQFGWLGGGQHECSDPLHP